MINKPKDKEKHTAGLKLMLNRKAGDHMSTSAAARNSASAGARAGASAGVRTSASAGTPDGIPDSGIPDSCEPANPYRMPPRRWFFTFMCMNIPIAGWIYLLHLAFGKKENQLRDFAKAYLIYKVVFLIAALIILGILVYVGMHVADMVLNYMEML